jgi:putative acetyltransferase
MEIRVDDLRGPEIAALLEQHLAHLRSISPPCSVHALDLERLRKPEITFWSVWDGEELVGCGALKELDRTHGEIKSMRTAAAHLRKGVASKVVKHIRRGEAARLQAPEPRFRLDQDFAAAHKLYAGLRVQPARRSRTTAKTFSLCMTREL